MFYDILHTTNKVNAGPIEGSHNNEVPPDSPHGGPAWNALAKAALKKRLQNTQNLKRAKNVIIFIGDGMGIATVAAARILKAQLKNRAGPEEKLAFEQFPHLALAKTYSVDKQIPDSACTATAILSGSKTNFGLIGYDANVRFKHCPTEKKSRRLPSFLSRGVHKGGKKAGVVTTTRLTHATPAAAFAHSAARHWERFVGQPDPWEPEKYKIDKDLSGDCSDIASQLVDGDHGIDVFLGGGRKNFLPTTAPDPASPAGSKSGSRLDGRDLTADWLRKQKAAGKDASYVWNGTALRKLDLESTEAVLGLFARSHLPYVARRGEAGADADGADAPTLGEMTSAALSILRGSESGFTLLVEGGRIDHGHHDGKAQLSLYETLAFDEAVEIAVNTTSKEDTLIVVTADHSHGFVFTGKPSRGNPIFGFDDYQLGRDGLPYTSLLYGTGPGFKDRVKISASRVGEAEFKQDAAVPLRSETHGGEDVPIYATGPFSHLFSGVMEQNEIAHIIMYAACINDASAGADHCRGNGAALRESGGGSGGANDKRVLKESGGGGRAGVSSRALQAKTFLIVSLFITSLLL